MTQILSPMSENLLQTLLGREPALTPSDELHPHISGKTVLVTGGGGSIGSEICRQVAKLSPKKLIIFDIYENNAFYIEQELISRHDSLDLSVLIGSVRDRDRIREVFDEYKPDIVYHAAAHKHVPLMENNPAEAVKNNIFGTYNTAAAALSAGCEKFVLISTDKAIRPSSVMGATKRVCEMIVQSMDSRAAKESGRIPSPNNTDFVTVRFGNVLGSCGSVIPLFQRQIEAGGPVTVTSPDVERYFMSISEAVSLVLEAGMRGKSGEIYEIDMGEPVKIEDLAERLIRLNGLEPGRDIKIRYTGLRPGEKLREEKLTSAADVIIEGSRLHVGQTSPIDADDLSRKLKILRESCGKNREELLRALNDIVPIKKP